MRLRADQQLFVTYLGLILALALAVTVGAESVLRRSLVDAVAEDLERELALARLLYTTQTDVSADSSAQLISGLTGRRVTLVSANGRLLAEVGPGATAAPRLDDYRIRPEIQAAAEGAPSRALRFDQDGREILFVAAPASGGDILRLASRLDDVDGSITAIHQIVFGAAALAVILAALFSFGFTVSIVNPMRRVGEAARALADGDLSRRVRFRRDDELGELGQALNRLADELQSRLGQLEGERAEMQALIDAMSEGVLALSPTGALRRANPAARRMFSLDPEAVGMPPEMISRRTDFLAVVNTALAGETIPPRELTGGGTWLLATAHPLPDGGAVLVFLDVSELRRLEGVRRDFVANASHELKTPLTAIRGYSETLDDPDLPVELVRRFSGIVKANADRLQRIVDDLLDLSRIEAGGWRVQPSSISIEELASEVWQAVVPRDKNIELRFELEPGHERVWADGSALRQVFLNLLSNACRYTPSGGTITVGADAGFPDAAALPTADGEDAAARDWTVVSVTDTGSGIPASHINRIFERFYRVDPARSREEGGTGLGLSIVKHLIESHGGWIEAESQVGEGTRIRFLLPTAPSDG